MFPVELYFMIFLLCDLNTLKNLLISCKTFYKLIVSEQFYLDHCNKIRSISRITSKTFSEYQKFYHNIIHAGIIEKMIDQEPFFHLTSEDLDNDIVSVHVTQYEKDLYVIFHIFDCKIYVMHFEYNNMSTKPTRAYDFKIDSVKFYLNKVDLISNKIIVSSYGPNRIYSLEGQKEKIKKPFIIDNIASDIDKADFVIRRSNCDNTEYVYNVCNCSGDIIYTYSSTILSDRSYCKLYGDCMLVIYNFRNTCKSRLVNIKSGHMTDFIDGCIFRYPYLLIFKKTENGKTYEYQIINLITNKTQNLVRENNVPWTVHARANFVTNNNVCIIEYDDTCLYDPDEGFLLLCISHINCPSKLEFHFHNNYLVIFADSIFLKIYKLS